MALKVLAACLALLVLAGWTDGSGCKKGMVCVDSFTYIVTNHLVWPFFNHSMTFNLEEGKPVIYYMELACVQNPVEFTKFSATFYKQYGFDIEAINGLAGNWTNGSGTYWEFWNTTTALSVGVSRYMPTPGDRVLLNFTADQAQQNPRHIPMTNGRR